MSTTHQLHEQPVAADSRQELAINQIRDALRGLRFGNIVVLVQDGVVVQIERTEKRRLTKPGSTS